MWRLIHKEYGPYIKYIRGEKNIVADAQSRLPLNGIQETKQNSIVPEINDNEEITEGNFPIHLELIKDINGQNPA